MNDLDKEILYWIEQFGYTPINTGKLIDYIKENWVVSKSHVVEEFVEAMEIRNLPSLHILDWDKICSEDNDYEELESGLYLNIYQLENNDLDLKRLNLII